MLVPLVPTIALSLVSMSSVTFSLNARMGQAPGLSCAWSMLAGREARGEWLSGDLERALTAARKVHKPVLVFFQSTTSDRCSQLRAESFESDGARSTLAKFVLLNVDIASAEGAALVARHKVTLVPTVLILSEGGDPEELMPGYRPAATLWSELQAAAAGRDTVSDLSGRVERKPRDLDQRLTLARKLEAMGSTEVAANHLAVIRQRDPRGKTLAGAGLLLDDAIVAATEASSDPSDLSTVDPSGVVAILKPGRPDPVLFRGWRWIASVEQARGDDRSARQALVKAWPHVPSTQTLGWLIEACGAFWQAPDSLTATERKTAIKLAEAAAAAADIELRQTPSPTDETIGAYEALARCYLLDGKRRRALAAVDRAIELQPDSEAMRRLRDQVVGK